MKEYFRQTIPFVEKAINDYFIKDVDIEWIRSTIGNVNHPFDTRVWSSLCSEPFYDLFERGGKRIRPIITCLTYQALGGKNPEIYKYSIIPEIIHAGTLIIDDIQDNSNFRRGKETIHIKYGTNLAINNGNFNYFFPQLILKNANISNSQKVKIYNVIAEEMTKIHIGQGMDILWTRKNYDVSIDDYLQMCAYKTGALFSIAAKIGAILTDANQDIIDQLGDVAYSIGTAFQIQDDILNLKLTDEDITEGKITYMIISTTSKASKSDRDKLILILKSNTREKQKIDEAISIIDKYDSFTEAQTYSEKIINKAKTQIQNIFADSEYKEIYLQILDFVIDRKK